MNNYPLGAELSPDAPWNQEDNPEREIEVLVSITMSKNVKIKVTDYQIVDEGYDEDGDYRASIDYSDCDLKSAVEEQIKMPQDAGFYMKKGLHSEEYSEFEDWHVDDFEVIKE